MSEWIEINLPWSYHEPTRWEVMEYPELQERERGALGESIQDIHKRLNLGSLAWNDNSKDAVARQAEWRQAKQKSDYWYDQQPETVMVTAENEKRAQAFKAIEGQKSFQVVD